MHTVRNDKLSKTKQVYQCGKQGCIAMSLIILNCENQLEKVHRICAEFTKMVHRICKLHVQNLQFLAQNSDNPTYAYQP